METEVIHNSELATPVSYKNPKSSGAIPKIPPATKAQHHKTPNASTTHSLPIHKEAISKTQNPKSCSPAVTRSNKNNISNSQQVNNNKKC